MKKATLAGVSIMLLVGGCSKTMMPYEANIPDMPWKSFDQVAAAYKEVVEGKTTLLELQKLGFDLRRVSRAKEWNEIATRNFLLGPNQNTRVEDLPLGAQECLLAQGGCRAQEFPIGEEESRGMGNFFMNLFMEKLLNIQKNRKVSGWGHPVIFFYRLSDKVALFKLSDPMPTISDKRSKSDPMGWLDSAGGVIGRAVKKGF